MRTLNPCASATPRTSRCSSTSTARSWTRSTRLGSADLPESVDVWELQKALAEHLEKIWRTPDQGIWEVRGRPQHFTHSKVMAWVAIDRAVKSAEQCKLDGPIDRWRALRDEIHADVCANGFNSRLNAFVQAYGSDLIDASLLLMPLVGFLPATDPRVRGTVESIEKESARRRIRPSLRQRRHRRRTSRR